jgi:hypothetical protein
MAMSRAAVTLGFGILVVIVTILLQLNPGFADAGLGKFGFGIAFWFCFIGGVDMFVERRRRLRDERAESFERGG